MLAERYTMITRTGPFRTPFDTMPKPVESGESANDLRTVDPRFGSNRTVSTHWLEHQKQSLAPEAAALIDHAMDALEGRVPVKLPVKEDEKGGQFALERSFQEYERVVFGVNEKGEIDRLEISNLNVPSAIRPGLSILPETGNKRTHDAQKFDAPADEPARVRMKLAGRENGQFPGGVSSISLKVADKTRSRYGDAGAPPKQPPQLAKHGVWRVTSSDGSSSLDKLDGHFIFVTLLNGEIRLGNVVNGQNAHASLAGHARDVRYAGTVTFSDGQIQAYSNESGTYLPASTLRHQAGFNQSAGFNAADDPFVPLDPGTEADARQAFEQMIRSRTERTSKPGE